MATDKTGYVSVGAEIEDEVMPDRVVFSTALEEASIPRRRAWTTTTPIALRSLRHWHPLVWMAS